jgi:hypothetical protein
VGATYFMANPSMLKSWGKEQNSFSPLHPWIYVSVKCLVQGHDNSPPIFIAQHKTQTVNQEATGPLL